MLKLLRRAKLPAAAAFYVCHQEHWLSKAEPSKSGPFLLSRNFVADCVEVSSPSVVNVLSKAEVPGNWGRQMQGTSSGSGFIISGGFVVTNAHVVQHNASGGHVQITQWNGKKRDGIIHSLDTATDICLIKLTDVGHDEELPIATLGSSSKLRPGEFVVALGSPLMLSNSVTFGIVSSTARQGTELGLRGSRNEYIQTDASINQGNSGGPLVNLDGHVVGINNMKLQGGDGISFAIPIDLAMQVVRQLKQNRRVIRPSIGVNIANFNPAKSRRRFQHQQDDKRHESAEIQVLIIDVVPGSPAEQAGLRVDDVIIEVDGRRLNGVHTLLHAIGIEIGRRLELKIRRDQTEMTVFVTTRAAESLGQISGGLN